MGTNCLVSKSSQSDQITHPIQRFGELGLIAHFDHLVHNVQATHVGQKHGKELHGIFGIV